MVSMRSKKISSKKRRFRKTNKRGRLHKKIKGGVCSISLSAKKIIDKFNTGTLENMNKYINEKKENCNNFNQTLRSIIFDEIKPKQFADNYEKYIALMDNLKGHLPDIDKELIKTDLRMCITIISNSDSGKEKVNTIKTKLNIFLNQIEVSPTEVSPMEIGNIVDNMSRITTSSFINHIEMYKLFSMVFSLPPFNSKKDENTLENILKLIKLL